MIILPNIAHIQEFSKENVQLHKQNTTYYSLKYLGYLIFVKTFLNIFLLYHIYLLLVGNNCLKIAFENLHNICNVGVLNFPGKLANIH